MDFEFTDKNKIIIKGNDNFLTDMSPFPDIMAQGQDLALQKKDMNLMSYSNDNENKIFRTNFGVPSNAGSSYAMWQYCKLASN